MPGFAQGFWAVLALGVLPRAPQQLWVLLKDTSSPKRAPRMCCEQWKWGLRLPSTPLSLLLHTDPEVLHLPKAQLVPASPAWAQIVGSQGGLGSQLRVPHPWSPLHSSWEWSSRAQNPPPCCPLMQRVPQGHNLVPSQLPQPSDAPGKEAAMAPKPPQAPGWHLGHSKSHRAMNPLLPAELCHCPQ